LSTLKLFFRDTAIYGLAAVLPRVINFLLVKIQTDALTTQSYADNTYFYIWASLFAVLLTFGMETAFFRFYKVQKDKSELISTAFTSLLIMVVVFIICMFLFRNFFINLFDFKSNPLRYKLWISILSLDTLAVIPFAYLRITNKPKKYTFIKLVNVGIIVLVQILFLTIIPAMIKSGSALPETILLNYSKTPKVNYIFISNVLGSAFSFILLLPILFRFKWKFNSNLFGKMINYSWPIMVAGVAYVINENLDKYLLKNMLGKSEMGIYAASYKLAIFMNLYIQAFRLGAEPFFFNNSDAKNAKQTYAEILNYFIIIGSIVLLIIVSYIDIIKYFINSRYWSGLVIVPIVLIANLFLGIYHNLSVWYKLTDKTKFGMYFSLIGAYFVGKKYYKVPYDMKKVGSYLLVSIGLSLLSFHYFRGNFIISTIIIITYIIFTLWSEKNLLKKILLKWK